MEDILKEDIDYICYKSNINIDCFSGKTVLVTGATAGLLSVQNGCFISVQSDFTVQNIQNDQKGRMKKGKISLIL